MSETDSKIAVVIAVIGVVGTLGAAVIANWDKIFPHSPKRDAIENDSIKPPPTSKPINEATPQPEDLLTMNSVWHDVGALDNKTRILQRGDKFEFTRWGVLPTGEGFEATGSGEYRGQNVTTKYTAKYEKGSTSGGTCIGQLTLNNVIKLDCHDSRFDNYSYSFVRE